MFFLLNAKLATSLDESLLPHLKHDIAANMQDKDSSVMSGAIFAHS